MSYEPVFLRAEVVLVYDRIDLTQVMAAGKQRQSEELILNQEFSADIAQRVVFLSVTGSSAVIVEPRRATLQTRYSREFAKPQAGSDLRRSNMTKKLEALFPLLETAHYTPLFMGVVLVARVATASLQESAALKTRVHGAEISRVLKTENGDWYDFGVRYSHIKRERYFATTQVMWYEERVMAMLTGSELVPAPDQIRDWDVPVDSSGIEIRIDMNNKRSLLNGDRKWTAAEFIDFAKMFHDESQSELQHALELVNLSDSKGSN